jgi:hypothetical protein
MAQTTRARKNVEPIKKKVDMEIEVQPRDTSKGHFYVSIVKSIVRIGAGGCLIQGNLLAAGALLIFAEILGVVEELV